MKPYIICHMVSLVDGKIDGAALTPVMPEGDYEKTAAKLRGDAWICGRTTMEYFTGKRYFVSVSKKLAGSQPAHIARTAKTYAIVVDTLGKLRWKDAHIGDDHLICVVSEQVPSDYLALLRKKGISYIVSGRASVDLADAMKQLGKHFGIRTLLLEGGGHINGAFLAAGLIDELSLLIAPGIDGRPAIPAVFDGMKTAKTTVALKLKSVTRRKGDMLWLRYTIDKSKAAKDASRRKTKS